jgi:hypothetical protein
MMMMSEFKVSIWGPGVVAHICNPSYLGSRDQEDFGLRTTQGKNAGPYQKTSQSKKQKVRACLE